MTWFAVYQKRDGRLVSTGQVVAPDDELKRRGLEKFALAFNPQAPEKQWNEGTRSFDDVVPSKPGIRLREFFERFTPAEREDVFDAAKNGTAAVQKKVGAFLDFLKMVDGVRTDDSYIVDSVNAMESNGFIGAGRAAEILNA